MNKRYVGERILQKCGQYAEIIELCDDYNKCRVRFDNGFERECTRSKFARGEVTNYCRGKRRSDCIELVKGLRVKQAGGFYAELIEVVDSINAIVKIDNKDKKVSLNSFKYGKLGKRARNGGIMLVCVNELGMIAVNTILFGERFSVFEDGSLIRKDISNAVKYNTTPDYMKVSCHRFYYKDTGEIVLNCYFDRKRCRYIGVLQRKNGTRYMRVLE